MTWPAELKPNTALNHSGVVDGSRERKGARRQRFLIQINTQPRLSSQPLLSNIHCSVSQWLFQRSLGERLRQIRSPLVSFFLLLLLFLRSETLSLFPSSISAREREREGATHLFPSHLAFPEPSFHGAFIGSLPVRHLPWSPGELILSCTKNVRHGLPSSRPPVN